MAGGEGPGMGVIGPKACLVLPCPVPDCGHDAPPMMIADSRHGGHPSTVTKHRDLSHVVPLCRIAFTAALGEMACVAHTLDIAIRVTTPVVDPV
jgi:hypothetical protein